MEKFDNDFTNPNSDEYKSDMGSEIHELEKRRETRIGRIALELAKDASASSQNP